MTSEQSPAQNIAAERSQRPWYRRPSRIVLAIVAVVVVAIIAVTTISPWPSAMLIRSVFEKGGAATVAEMLPYVPDTPLTEHLDVEYGDAGADTSFDAFSPQNGTEPLPTIVWV